MTIEIRYRDRPMHVYMPGKTRFGKSTLIFWMALEDIENDQGVCVIEPKGDLVGNLLKAVPKRRRDDAIYLDIDTPVPIDFMSYRTDREKEKLIGELKFILLKTVEPQHAPLMNANLEDELYTLLNFNENPDFKSGALDPKDKATFLDIYYFLENKTRRDFILDHVTDPDLKDRWEGKRFPNDQERSRITTRMTPFVRSKSLRAIFGAPDPPLRIEDAIRDRKIVLVKLGDDEIQSMYGTLLISKIRQAASRQADLPEEERIPFFLYCDEFQLFQTSDFDRMLSIAGGFGLCMTLANQFVEQLDPQILASIKGNISTFICFRLGAPSAHALRDEIPSLETERVWKRDPDTGLMAWQTKPLNFDPATLTRLPKFRVLHRAADGTAKFTSSKKWPRFKSDGYADYIKTRTKEKYRCEGNPPSANTSVSRAAVSVPAADSYAEASPDVPADQRKKKEPRASR
jgi:hypothetical protein